MKYNIKSGILSRYDSGTPLARIKNTFLGSKKEIHMNSDERVYTVEAEGGENNILNLKSYVLKHTNEKEILIAYPEYAKDEDPEIEGWPLCRNPRVDRAIVMKGSDSFLLVMNNNQNYSFYDAEGKILLQVMHKGIGGGWVVDTVCGFSPEEICAIFIFCRYIEQENEFFSV